VCEVLAKILTITISDEAHAKLQEIKKRHQLSNNAELFEFLIYEIAKREEKLQ
jgi:predicted CopG family antitoxin